MRLDSFRMHNTWTDSRSPRVYSVYTYNIFAKIGGGFCTNSRSIQGIKVFRSQFPLHVIRMDGSEILDVNCIPRIGRWIFFF